MNFHWFYSNSLDFINFSISYVGSFPRLNPLCSILFLCKGYHQGKEILDSIYKIIDLMASHKVS